MPYSKAKQKAWRERNPDYARDYNLRFNYGISLDDFKAMLASQNGVCAICDKPSKPNGRTSHGRLNVDHDHKTGAVRGLLCSTCNRGIGMFCDNPDLLVRAAAYLKDGGGS